MSTSEMSRVSLVQHLAVAGALMVLLVSAGCSSDSTPTAPGQEPPRAQTGAGGAPALFSFGAAGGAAAKSSGAPAATDADAGLPSVSGDIGPHGGKLKIKVKGPRKNAAGERIYEDLKVELRILKGALSQEVPISMTVRGHLLSELVIAFTPAGLVFARDARLTIELGRDRVDLDPATLFGVHTTATGEVETVAVEVDGKGGGKPGVAPRTLRVRLQVPGFSRYGLRRGR